MNRGALMPQTPYGAVLWEKGHSTFMSAFWHKSPQLFTEYLKQFTLYTTRTTTTTTKTTV